MALSDMLAFQTPKLVRVHDKRLGALYYLFMLAVAVYVVYGQILYNHRCKPARLQVSSAAA